MNDYQFNPGDKVIGSWDTATVISVTGIGRNARVLIEWDEVDAAGVDRGPGRRCERLAWTITKLEADAPVTD